jgi:hypothetical protein
MDAAVRKQCDLLRQSVPRCQTLTVWGPLDHWYQTGGHGPLAPSLGSRWAAQRVGRWARQAGRLRALVQRRARAGLADAECQTQPRHAHLAVAPKPPIPHHHRRRHRHQAAVRSPAGVAAASRPAVQTVACPSAYRMVNTLASVVGSLPHRVGPVEGEGRLREGDPSCPSSGQTQTHRAAYDTVKRHCLPSDAAAVAAAARRREGAMPLCRRHRQPPCSPMLMMRLSAGNCSLHCCRSCFPSPTGRR